MSKALKIILIIAVVALAAWYFYGKSKASAKSTDGTIVPSPGNASTDTTSEGESEVSTTTPENSAPSAMDIQVELAPQYAHAAWLMSWKGVTVEGVTKGASYDWSQIRYTTPNNLIIDKLYDTTANGARFVIVKWVGTDGPYGFMDAPGERIWLMIFDANGPLVPNNQLTWQMSRYAIEFDIVTGAENVLKQKS